MGPSAAVSTSEDQDGLIVKVVITNGDAGPLRLCTATFAPSLALEVTDAAGVPVPLGPPPMPPSDLESYTATIEPGGSLPVSYTGAEIFPGGIPAGRYKLRFAASIPAIDDAWSGPIISDWVAFTVD
jgi:hypothetical protein